MDVSFVDFKAVEDVFYVCLWLLLHTQQDFRMKMKLIIYGEDSGIKLDIHLSHK
jgi:hypothetical protein